MQSNDHMPTDIRENLKKKGERDLHSKSQVLYMTKVTTE